MKVVEVRLFGAPVLSGANRPGPSQTATIAVSFLHQTHHGQSPRTTGPLDGPFPPSLFVDFRILPWPAILLARLISGTRIICSRSAESKIVRAGSGTTSRKPVSTTDSSVNWSRERWNRLDEWRLKHIPTDCHCPPRTRRLLQRDPLPCGHPPIRRNGFSSFIVHTEREKSGIRNQDPPRIRRRHEPHPQQQQQQQ